MPDSPPRKLSLANAAIDALLCLVAFAIFFALAEPHVPSNDRVQVGLWASATAACMTGVFWLAWQMLKSVYRHQRANRRPPPK